MSQQVPTHYAQQYATNIELLAQQKGSRFEGTVTPQTITGAKAATPVEQIGAVEATDRATRYPPLTPADTPHSRPWLYPVDSDWNDLVDSIDQLRMVVDPKSKYVENGNHAMNRRKDKRIIDAFFATRNIGETGASTQSFPAAQQISVSFGASGAVGLTVAKMREAKRLLMAAEIEMESDTLTIGVAAKQHDNLLAEMQVISLDFNEKPVMVEGMVTRFLGFNLKHSERMSLDGSSYRRCPAFAKSGMVLGTWKGITTDISQRKDLAGLPWQIYVYGTFGATRTEEVKVVEIPCSEA